MRLVQVTDATQAGKIREYVNSHVDAYGETSFENVNHDGNDNSTIGTLELYKVMEEIGREEIEVGFLQLFIFDVPKNSLSGIRYSGYQCEIAIGTYDEYQRKGYAKNCILNITKLLPGKDWLKATLYGDVKCSNKNRGNAENLLKKCGFDSSNIVVNETIEYVKEL